MAKGHMNLNDKVQFKPTKELLEKVNAEFEDGAKYVPNDLGYLNIRLWEFMTYFGKNFSDTAGIKGNEVFVQVEFV